MTRLEQQVAFLCECDRMKHISRQTWLADGSRKENDAEHSWHVALCALLLGEYANKPADLGHVIAMLLCHDLVEIYAGDTFAYDTEGNKTKPARERAAADRLFSMLPEDQALQLRGLWEEFDAGETDDAKFANAIDRFQPAMLAGAVGGKGWVEHSTKLSSILARGELFRQGSETLYAYNIENWIKPGIAAGKIVNDCEIK